MFGDRTAIIYGDRRASYAEFADEVQRLARVLKSRIARGERIAYLAPNIPEMLVAHYAVPLAGGVLVALNSRLAGPELVYILNHAGVTTLFFDAEFRHTVSLIADEVPEVATTVEITDPEFGPTMGDVARRGSPACRPMPISWPSPTVPTSSRTPSRGPSTTRTPSSPSTTPRGPPENPRASCTPTAGHT